MTVLLPPDLAARLALMATPSPTGACGVEVRLDGAAVRAAAGGPPTALAAALARAAARPPAPAPPGPAARLGGAPAAPGTRPAVVAEALSWLGTPYHHLGRLKGVGVDCGQLVALVYEAAGVIRPVEIAAYPRDWHLHRDEERYLTLVQQHAPRQVHGAPGPGDVVLFRWGRCVSHGAIVIAWPRVVHAYVGQGVVLDDAQANAELATRLHSAWSPWGE